MSVFPIKWHQNCLENARRSLEEDRARCERYLAMLRKSEDQVAHYEAQINRAIKEKKNGFDAEKYKASP